MRIESKNLWLKAIFLFLGSSAHPTCWAVVSEDTTDVLMAREKELYRLKQDEYHTSAMVILPKISSSQSYMYVIHNF